ncbi:MAG: hypothetical protein R3C97_12970 [Geminicoccaceae bacterium]
MDRPACPLQASLPPAAAFLATSRLSSIRRIVCSNPRIGAWSGRAKAQASQALPAAIAIPVKARQTFAQTHDPRRRQTLEQHFQTGMIRRIAETHGHAQNREGLRQANGPCTASVGTFVDHLAKAPR